MSKSDSSSSCLARSFKNSAWSMSSLMTALEESPSTICSHSRYSYTTNYSHHATEFSTPRDQVRIACLEHTMPLSSPLSACNVDNNNNSSTCLSDIDEWLEHSNKFCKSSIHLTESVHSGQSGSPEEEDSRLSAICSTYLAAQEHELHNITLPCVREDSSVFQGQSCISCTCKPPKFGGYERTRLMGPYDEFLDDIRRRKQEAERDARKKAKHVELILKLRRKENALNDWELQQTRKAMDKMDKIQNELERKQFKASARTQKKICLVREKAEKQKLKLRRSAMKRFQQIQTSKTRSPSEISWGSRLPLC